MNKKIIIGIILVLIPIAILAINHFSKNDNYEPISSSEFSITLKLSGRVGWDKEGKANGGPIEDLSFWGNSIELESNMIKDGFILTKSYGKIKMTPRANFTMQIELTPTQQSKILKLKDKK